MTFYDLERSVSNLRELWTPFHKYFWVKCFVANKYSTLGFFKSNLGFCLELGLLKFFLCNPEVRLKKKEKSKKRSTFTCIKSLYNLRHNNCVIFSIFLYFKYSFLSNSLVYKFVHAIIFLFIERKAISCLSVELPKIYQYWCYLIIL